MEEKQLLRPTLEVVKEVEEREVAIKKIKDLEENDEALNELYAYKNQFDWSNYTFTDPTTGKTGVKDVTGKVLVPAEYDDFNFIGAFDFYHETPKPAKKDGKWGLVTGNGTNQVLADFKYDDVRNYPYSTLFCYHADGKKDTFGILTADGKELVPNILTSYFEPCNGIVVIESNGKYGVVDEGTYDVILPQYDYADCGEIDGNVIFTKDGVKGYVNTHNEFVSIEDYDAGNFDVEETFFYMDSCPC